MRQSRICCETLPGMNTESWISRVFISDIEVVVHPARASAPANAYIFIVGNVFRRAGFGPSK